MTTVVANGYAWVAEKDGTAHARPVHGRSLRTLCGRVAVDERYGHPPAVRCDECQAAVERAGRRA